MQPTGAPQAAAVPARSRRGFLSLAGGSGAAVALLSACGSSGTKTGNGVGQSSSGGDPFGQGDLGVVNFALTLEYIESDFYTRVLDSGVLSGSQLDLFRLIANDERQHVAALEHVASTMGSKVKRPQTNFSIQNPHQVLTTASDLENTGAAAYLGQADQIISQDLLKTALTIHTVEGRHAAELNRLVGRPFTPDGPFASPLSRDDVMLHVDPFLA